MAAECTGGSVGRARGSATIPADPLGHPTGSSNPTLEAPVFTDRPPLRVAVLGAGTVGGEVVRGLTERGHRIARSAGTPIALTGIAVRDAERAIARGLPASLVTDAPAHLVASDETDLMVELMGGDEPAFTLIAACLGAGRPVVTANKHVIAHHGPQLETLARAHGVSLRFEAAVGGGTPVLGPLAVDLATNDIRRVRGIVNGTTNFILTMMAEEGRPYAEALEEAQSLGYAEADPSGDVEGADAVNKLVILARLAFGEWLDPSTIRARPPTVRGEGAPGITGVSDREIEGAAALGYAVRLLASASLSDDGIVASVIPTCVATNSPFGWTTGVTNRVEIEGEPVGTIRIAGPGAGGPETSSAVLADIVAVARGLGSTWAGLPAPEVSASASMPAGDALGGRRHWFAWLPPIDVEGSLPAALDESAAVPFEDGTAIRTEHVTLAEAREALASLLPSDVDVTLYPCDD
jgi:homoserine dehydrogenase